MFHKIEFSIVSKVFRAKVHMVFVTFSEESIRKGNIWQLIYFYFLIFKSIFLQKRDTFKVFI